jgi:hypothetical protein
MTPETIDTLAVMAISSAATGALVVGGQWLADARRRRLDRDRRARLKEAMAAGPVLVDQVRVVEPAARIDLTAGRPLGRGEQRVPAMKAVRTPPGPKGVA